MPATYQVIKSWPTDRAREWLYTFLGGVYENSNVLAVVAVGSSVRAASADDLDLIVLCQDIRLFRTKPPIEVDIRAFEWKQVDAAIRQGRDLLLWAIRYGVPLWDPAHRWHGLVDRWKVRLPFPDPKEALNRAKAARADLQKMKEAGDIDAMQDLNVSYLTHLARARLSAAGVFPASRPELPDQLREIGQRQLAKSLATALAMRAVHRAANPP